MPAKRKTYARRRPAARRTYKRRATGARLSKAAWLYGKMYDRTKRQERLATGLAELSGAALTVPQDAIQESNDAFMARKVTGRGAYAFGRHAQKFLQGRMGTAIRDRAVGMISGQGMYTGQGAYGHGGFGASTAKRILGNGMYTGQGEYSGNNLVDDVASAGAVPSFGSVGDETGAVMITHREYICDIYANGTGEDFHNTSFPLNPGMEETYPWLSQLAQNFEEYEMMQCMFTFRSTIADVSSSNGQVGTVIMTTNYNAADAPFRDKARMMGYAHSCSDKSTAAQVHGVECDPSKLSGSSGKFVRSQGLGIGEDIKTYDHGTFQIAIANTPEINGFTNSTIGELWVSYSFIFRKPLYHTNQALGIQRSIWTSGAQGQYNMRTVGMLGNPTLMLRGVHNSLDCRITPITSDASFYNPKLAITFPAAYSGNVEIRLDLRTRTDGDIVNTADPFDILEFEDGSPEADTKGNVQPIYDIYCGDDVVANAADPGYKITQKATVPRYTSLFHVRVDVATQGKDNTITIQLSAADIGDPSNEELLRAGVLSITEYNQSFGTDYDPRPLLVNNLGAAMPFVYN